MVIARRRSARPERILAHFSAVVKCFFALGAKFFCGGRLPFTFDPPAPLEGSFTFERSFFRGWAVFGASEGRRRDRRAGGGVFTGSRDPVSGVPRYFRVTPPSPALARQAFPGDRRVCTPAALYFFIESHYTYRVEGAPDVFHPIQKSPPSSGPPRALDKPRRVRAAGGASSERHEMAQKNVADLRTKLAQAQAEQEEARSKYKVAERKAKGIARELFAALASDLDLSPSERKALGLKRAG